MKLNGMNNNEPIKKIKNISCEEISNNWKTMSLFN